MKKRGIILTILIIVALMAVSGCIEEDCDSSQENKGQIKESSSVNEDLKYITYKRDEIIENVEKLNLKIGMESAMYSRKIVLEDIKKYLPIDNIRKISGGFLIEYPMEDSEFAIITDGEGIVWGSFLRHNVLHTILEMELITKGMTLEEVKKIFPEIAVEVKAKEILNDNKHKNDEIECQVMLENYLFGKIIFKNKNGKIVVAESETIDIPFPDNTMKEVLEQNPEQLEDRNSVITSSGEIIAGREAWNKFYMLTKGNELTKLTEQITEELLNVRNQSILIKTYYGDNNFFEEETEENVSGFIEQIIVYDGKQFLVNKWENGENKISTYKYLVERKGRMPNAAVGEHGFYLVNDNSLTYEQLQWSSLSSQCSDYIDYYTVFYEIYYE